jgi:hypothetical protein
VRASDLRGLPTPGASVGAHPSKGSLQAMLFRVSEVLGALALIVLLLAAKWMPVFAGLPLAQMAGIVSFSFAIFLSLRIYNAELARIRAE